MFGIEVVECKWLTTVISKRRSWRERLFTRPWKPWVSCEFIKTPYFIELDGVVYAHPDLNILGRSEFARTHQHGIDGGSLTP